MKKQRTMNNKGFSLVELIVVIAIMAILVGLLAPQFLKYVGKSKTATDASNQELLESAAKTALSDEAVKVATNATVTITNDADSNYGEAVYTGFPTGDDSFQKALESAIGTVTVGGATVGKFPETKSDNNTGYEIKITGSDADGYTATCTMTATPTAAPTAAPGG